MVVRMGRITAYPPGIIEYRQPKTAAVPAGWWAVAGKTCLAAYQPKGAADLAASYVNLVTPGTYDAAPGVAPTLTANGWQGTWSAWLNTGIANSAMVSFLIQYGGGPDSYAALLGGTNAGWDGMTVWPNYGTQMLVAHYGGDNTQLGVSAGNLGFAGQRLFVDGIYIKTTDAGTSTVDVVYLLAMNLAGTASFKCGFWVSSFAAYSDALSDGEFGTVAAAMAAL